MKLKTKLNIVSGILTLVAVAVGVVGITGIRQTNAGLETVYNDRVVPLKQLKAIADDYAVAIIDAVNKANAGLTTAEETLKGVETASENIRKNWSVYMATRLTAEESKLVQEAKSLFASADEAVGRLRKHLSGKAGKLQGALGDFDGPLYEQIDPISTKITELVDLQLRVAYAEYTAAQAGCRTVLWLSIGILLAGVVLGGGFGWVIVRSVTTTLANLTEGLQSGADQTAAASAQVSKASQSLAEGASEQAASLEETSASLEEMSSMATRNTESAQSAKNAANQARAVADGGAENVQQMGEAIAGIQQATQEMKAAIGAIQLSGHEVSKIVKTIDEIAFQTNILALNAAVEAARAGEAGLGFAVVADEVRNLAQRSAKAAKETADKIEDALRKGEEGVRVSERVAESTRQVEAKAATVGTSLQEIVAKIRQLDEMMGQVASASKEQKDGVSQINTAVSLMDKTTQNTAATAEESASASEELNAQAATLRDTVAGLRTLITGGTGDVPPGNGSTAAAGASHAQAAGREAGVPRGIPMPVQCTSRSADQASAQRDFRDF